MSSGDAANGETLQVWVTAPATAATAHLRADCSFLVGRPVYCGQPVELSAEAMEKRSGIVLSVRFLAVRPVAGPRARILPVCMRCR